MSTTLIVTILVAYFAVLVGISLLTSRKADNAAFFLGERKSPWYIVSFGMIGASLSGVTFISVPGGVESGQFSYMQMVFGYFVGYFVVSYVLMPIYYRMNLTSIYEYLERRFGFWSYKTGAAFFLLSRVVGASIRLLLVASVLQQVLFDDWGIPFWMTVVISVLLIWIYTSKGGIKTIIWTDTLQTAFMLFAVIFTVFLVSDALNLHTEGGVFEAVLDSSYSRIFFFDDWHSGNYFWKHFLGGMFITIGMTGLDQDMMQKNLSCKNIKEAQKNMVSMASVLVVVNFIFLSMGALLFMYNNATAIGNEVLADGRTDLLFSAIAMDGSLGTVVGVLFLLGLIAAAYSSADSALTSLTTSFSIDFLSVSKLPANQQESLRKRVHVLMSVVLILTVVILRYTTEDSAIWLLIKLAGFTYGPLIGLFFFGILTKRQLKDNLVPVVCIAVAVGMASIWFLSSNGIVTWFGDYKFGAELIIYNAIVSFVGLYLISHKTSVNLDHEDSITR
ncbi:MAG: sodium:solute symporter [Crocinitomicaceae bacterium]|nr:sodium:solute symporter [Crocinitomicaceae bacterium]